MISKINQIHVCYKTIKQFIWKILLAAAPVKSYPSNSIGIYDMMGNVWELTSDLFNVDYYKSLDTTMVLVNPKGAKKHFNPSNPFEVQHCDKRGFIFMPCVLLCQF